LLAAAGLSVTLSGATDAAAFFGRLMGLGAAVAAAAGSNGREDSTNGAGTDA